ncbi:hypothetical protein DV515_00000330 [Chloebia gouldiae]|uniref:Uncharacterized protein n=1 Tax=Chloebia gouldiae TaxID=44316 RepID=A0A3L8T0L3_CHLGU|nr:hypothetical protein DV515_00000330 [Chloebia gouldiae]
MWALKRGGCGREGGRTDIAEPGKTAKWEFRLGNGAPDGMKTEAGNVFELLNLALVRKLTEDLQKELPLQFVRDIPPYPLLPTRISINVNSISWKSHLQVRARKQRERRPLCFREVSCTTGKTVDTGCASHVHYDVRRPCRKRISLTYNFFHFYFFFITGVGSRSNFWVVKAEYYYLDECTRLFKIFIEVMTRSLQFPILLHGKPYARSVLCYFAHKNIGSITGFH